MAGFLSEALGFSNGCSIIGIISFAFCLVYAGVSSFCKFGVKVSSVNVEKVVVCEESVGINMKTDENSHVKITTDNELSVPKIDSVWIIKDK